MAAIYDEHSTLDINKLSTDLKEHLAFYAIPKFIRILTKIDLTGIRIINFFILIKIIMQICLLQFEIHIC